MGLLNDRLGVDNSAPAAVKEPEPVRETEKDYEEFSLMQMQRDMHTEKKDKRKTKITLILLSILLMYVLFLIYGVVVTKYQYNADGEKEAVSLTVSEIKKAKNFNELKVQYENCRVLYEKVLLIDYRLGQGVEDPLTIAPEYEALLEEVNNLTIKTDALDVDVKYETIKNLLLKWVKTDVAVYLQKISSGITSNNAEDAAIAVEYKDIVYSDFSLITQNIITIGDSIKGVDMTGVKQWSPSKYLEETVGGK